LQKEKVRVYVLARELNMESKDLLDMCRNAGMDVKNQLSGLDPEQRDAIELLLKKGSKSAVAVAATAVPVAPLPSRLDNRIRDLQPTRRPTPAAGVAPAAPAAPVAPVSTAVVPPAPPAAAAPPAPVAAVAAPPVVAPPAPPVTAPPKPLAVPAPAVIIPVPAPTPAPSPEPIPEIQTPVLAPAALAVEPPKTSRPPEPVKPPEEPRAPEAPAVRPSDAPPVIPPELRPRVPELSPPKIPNMTMTGGKVPSLQSRSDPGLRPRPQVRPQIRPTMARPHIATPPPRKPLLGGKKPEEKKAEPVAQRPIAPLPKALAGKSNLTPQEIEKAVKNVVNQVPGAPPAVGDPEIEDEEGGDAKGKARPGSVVGRDARHASRSERQKARKEREVADVLRGTGRAVDILKDDDQPTRAQKRAKLLKKLDKGPKPRIGKVPVELPITVRSLSEAIGKKAGELLFKLRDHGAPPSTTINSTIDALLAEVIAHDYGVEIEIKKPVDAEEQLVVQAATDKPEDLLPRPPIVTIMGHVDHGKTTLLDKIRASNVAATEAGGITQVIRAWRVEHHGKAVTFLDTPGHEAFTKMRARGANVTDIAVIVVAADDGVMPQTEEAINHARAAGVAMVVCINKVDLPNANLNKTRQQLYGLNLLPDNMGGDIPFVETSAAKGTGIEALLEAILLVAEYQLADKLKANPNKAARGTCLEAMLSEGEGVRATVLVRDGTLRRGDVLLCGASHGRVRAMYDDLGRPIQEAGPSTPVRLTGLDEVPNADDPFQAVPELATAREIAEKRKGKQQDATAAPRAPMSLETLTQNKVAELKVILKADFRGSIEAIKKELDKLAHEEVRVKVLHAAIGGITESDVQLALTSPEDTLVLGFNVVPDDRAKAMAEERGVQIREYDIIYNLTDDIRSALEGKLKPHEQVIYLGRAVVRKIFKVGRVGTVAGCHVTQGVIERSAKIRLIRAGMVVYPPPDRSAAIETLRRIKDDAREVREGFECGIKIANYDDIKVDDVIEAYRVEQVQRTL